ncbi:protein DEHYDRATION-INDUCED 19 homolog 2-like [Wolffia australiana]
MEPDSWDRPAGTSRRHFGAIQSRFDSFLGFEDVEAGEDDARTEFPCPYCGEDFDMAGLCHHITDEHAFEAKTGVCPICEARIGMDILDYVGHITIMHGHFLKVHRRRRLHRGSSMSHSALSQLKKELREGQLQTLLGGSSYMTPAPNTAPDPLLSSFMYKSPSTASFKDALLQTSDSKSAEKNKTTTKKNVESVEQSLSEKEQKERARRSSFVQELVLSAVFADDS